MAGYKQIVVGSVVASTALACGWIGGTYSGTHQEISSASAASAPTPAPEARKVGESFVDVAERLAPSVVRITTQKRLAASPRGLSGNPFEGTPFEHFFDRFGEGDAPSEPNRMVTGMGSGVVIDTQGHILTNNHVVADADEVQVAFVDGKELAGKIVGTDPKTDLAVLKVDGANAKPAEFGDSKNMHVGEWVIAIGNPFGLDHSVTVGVLSAKDRYGFAPGKLEDFLQTDASINPGNSGGPLVNLSGQVIGINTMIAGLGTGVGFAVSEAIARPIARQLVEHGKVVRPFIGIAMQTMTPELRKALGDNPPENGALVSQVQKGSPAEAAGVRAGDVVVSIDGKTMRDSREVQQAVLAHEVGQKLDVKVWRNGKEMSLKVTTAELPGERATPKQVADPRGGKLGLALDSLTPDLSERLGLGRGTKGAVVKSVRPGSAAAEAGLREGDAILEIDRAPVTSAEDAAQRLASARPAGHLVQVRRGDASVFIVLKSP
jgi:serine protease Do